MWVKLKTIFQVYLMFPAKVYFILLVFMREHVHVCVRVHVRGVCVGVGVCLCVAFLRAFYYSNRKRN